MNLTNNFNTIYYGLFFLSIIITLIAQFYVNSSYSKFKKKKNNNGYTGFETARKILDNNGLKDIMILETQGNLTDHYDPKRNVIKLSKDIYHGTSIASLAVAAHECGHAIQDKENYTFLRIRNSIVPVVNLSSKFGYIVIFIGMIFGSFDLALLGILLLCAMLIFQLITLPVEFDASKRAKEEVKKLNITSSEIENNGISTMLTSAALTYVASLATTLIEVLRLLLVILNNRDRR